MSEYQYYEFVAVDRPLTASEMAELRALSTRATITPTRLVNVYHWGNFKGNPLTLMQRYFDAFLYRANWGTHRLMLRLPRSLLDPREATPYCMADRAEVHQTADHVILEFRSESEEGHWSDDENDEEGVLASLLPLRADIAGGDRRALYLAWLLCAQDGGLDDAEVEPPVPPGLGRLSASLTALAAFLRIGDDLIAVAAERSPTLSDDGPPSADLEAWVASLPEAEKNDLLLRLIQGHGAHIGPQLLLRFRHDSAPAGQPDAQQVDSPRTVADLLDAAAQRAEDRQHAEAERRAREQARADQERAAARAAHLATLVGREDELWGRVEALIETRRQDDYDAAVRLLADLRDLDRRGPATSPTTSPGSFSTRLLQFRARHARKPSLISRLDRADLSS